MHKKSKQINHITHNIWKNFELSISTQMCLHIKQNDILFLTISSSEKDADPESRSEVSDFHLEDPESTISDQEHCF